MPATKPQINETNVKMMVESMSIVVLLGGMLHVPLCCKTQTHGARNTQHVIE